MISAWIAALTASGFLAGCALPPEGVGQEGIARYDAAAKSLGCQLVTEPDYLAAEIQTGLKRQQLLDITAYKLSSGGAVRLPDGGVKLTTGACA